MPTRSNKVQATVDGCQNGCCYWLSIPGWKSLDGRLIECLKYEGRLRKGMSVEITVKEIKNSRPKSGEKPG